jgi:hypothetical protein
MRHGLGARGRGLGARGRGPEARGQNTGRFAGMTERSQFRMTKADSPLSTVYYAEVGENA